MTTKQSQFVPASAMTIDENCLDGTSSKVLPTAGSLDRIACPPSEGSGAAFCWAPPSNYAGGLKCTVYGHANNTGPGDVVPFVAGKVIAESAQFALPENATMANAAVTLSNTIALEEVRAELTPTLEGTWSNGDMITFWVGRLSTGDTYGDTFYIVGVKLEYDVNL